jgi:glycine oxidase
LHWDGARTLRVNGLYRHGYMIAPEVAGEAARFAAALLEGRVSDAQGFAQWRSEARWSELFQRALPDPHEAAPQPA